MKNQRKQLIATLTWCAVDFILRLYGVFIPGGFLFYVLLFNIRQRKWNKWPQDSGMQKLVTILLKYAFYSLHSVSRICTMRYFWCKRMVMASHSKWQ